VSACATLHLCTTTARIAAVVPIADANSTAAAAVTVSATGADCLQRVMRAAAALHDAGSAMALLLDMPKAQQQQRQQQSTTSTTGDSPLPGPLPGTVPPFAFHAAAVALRSSCDLQPHLQLLELALAQKRAARTAGDSDAPEPVPLALLLQAALHAQEGWQRSHSSSSSRRACSAAGAAEGAAVRSTGWHAAVGRSVQVRACIRTFNLHSSNSVNINSRSMATSWTTPATAVAAAAVPLVAVIAVAVAAVAEAAVAV
jgi:hypothetical protein